VLCSTCLAFAVTPARAQELTKAELARLSQNPIANLISVPIENDFNLNVGPDRGLQDVLKVQPVFPITLSPNWNLITRTTIPVIFNPRVGPIGPVGGLGDIQLSGFFSPVPSGSWTWGAGPIMQYPTHTDRTLGNDNLGLGPTGVVVHIEHGSPWLFGVLVNNVWSLATNAMARPYSNGLLEPFVNYNFGDGWYLHSSPIVTMDWLAPPGQQLLLPLGGGVGKIVHLGKLPVNFKAEAYYNVVRPDFASDWQIRAQVQFMFPK
jgi:hypothetical protein